MKIYGSPTSTCTRKVIMTLHEKNQPFELTLVDLRKGEHKHPAHLQRHPYGVIPVLEDDGFRIYESRAIIRYLDAKYPNNKLTPKDVHNYGRMEQWISVEQSYFSGPAIQLIKQLLWGKALGIAKDENIITEAKLKIQYAFDEVEKVLAKQLYLAGDIFSLADISWMPYIDYLFPSGLGNFIEERPFLNNWWQNISQRPTWQKIVNP